MKRIHLLALASILSLGVLAPLSVSAQSAVPEGVQSLSSVQEAPKPLLRQAATTTSTADGPVRKTPPPPSLFDYSEGKGDFLRMTFAVATILLLLWGWQLEESGKGPKSRKGRRLGLAFLGLMGVFGWFNYGKFHNGNFVHVWEHYHYYVGAKYFPELRFARLYECSAIAEVELGRKALVEKRKIRDLAETNLIGPTDDVLANPDRCKQHFTAERWDAFKEDIRFFTGRLGGRWADSQKDHGYNATPWWNITGSLLANAVGPASNQTMLLFALVDPVLVLLTFGFVWWAFGLEIFAVAATFFAVNFPSRFYWNGGAFLRYDYLAFAIIGICLLKKRKSATGGAFLATSASLRIFPVMFVVGPALQAGWHWFKHRTLPKEHKRMLVGAVVASALLVPASMVVAGGGTEIFSEFAHNTLKHSDTPLTNHMGLRTIVAWRPWDNAKSLKDNSLDDPFKTWKEQRLANYDQLKLLFLALNLALVWSIWRVSRDEPAWVAAALSGTILCISAAELTCYYYAFMIPGAFLMEKRKEAGLWLIVMGMGTHAITRLGIWNDEQYMWMSVASLAWGVAVLWWLLEPKLQKETLENGSGTLAVAPVSTHGKK